MNTRYSRRVWAGFEAVFGPWMSRRLDGVHVRGLENVDWLPELPVLLLANHVSWWDGFLLREVHRRLRPAAPFHVVMTEGELRRIPIFRWMGALPLGDGPMAARTLLREMQPLARQDPPPVFGYFPQGRIWPSHRRPLGFRRGGTWLAGRLAPIAVVPVGLHLEHMTRPGPAAFVSVGRPRIVRGPLAPDVLESDVTELVDGLLHWTSRHGEEAGHRWPEAA